MSLRLWIFELFKNAYILTSITGVYVDLIKRFYVILQTFSNGCEINVDKFQVYALLTACNFIQLYPWFYSKAHK